VVRVAPARRRRFERAIRLLVPVRRIVRRPQTARSITLPDDAKIRIVAITATDEPAPVVPAQPLYDTLAR